MIKTYVEQYGQLENSHWWFIIRRNIILQTLRKFVPKNDTGKLKILNVGAAAGGSTKWLSALGDVISLENDPLFLDFLAQQNVEVINASITNIPLDDNSIDLVCAFDVIEHVENDGKAMKELERVCKPGGSICITVPAFQSLWGNHDVVNGHKRRYVKHQLIKLPDHQTTTILYSSYFNSILFIPIFFIRKTQHFFKRSLSQPVSDFTYFKSNGFINKCLKFIFGLEPFFLKWISFPFGVSLIIFIRKNTFIKNGPD